MLKTRIAVFVSGGGTNLQALIDARISALLEQRRIELIILAGYMSILSADFTARWPERILNVHPSLIPAFCGKGYYGLRVHEAALARGVKLTGATPETLQRRVMEQAEWIILPKAAELVAANLAKEREHGQNV